jgi:SAM-dependent methyltransferase
MKLNLACGRNKIDGWHNVDINSRVAPNEQLDLLKFPWPYGDASVEEIFCSHFVEHIGDELIDFMDEAHRILKPGGTFRIRCPYYTSIRAWQDPTHKRPVSEFLFYYFNAEQRKTLGVDHYPIKSDFEIAELRYHYPEDMRQMPEEERGFMRVHAWNTVADIEVLLKKHDPNAQSLDRQKNSLVQ